MIFKDKLQTLLAIFSFKFDSSMIDKLKWLKQKNTQVLYELKKNI
jgi:hypothetical protein